VIAMSVFMIENDRRVRRVRSVLCVGLDPTPEHVPPVYGDCLDLAVMQTYLSDVVNLAAEKVAVVKPQFAYYGALGPDGIRMMIEVIEYAKGMGLPVILDAKRADIGDTMEQYGGEVFGQYGVDLCTFVPYLGSTFLPSGKSKGWLPWLEMGHGVIPMIMTSNPESVSVQMLELKDGRYVYQAMAEMVRGWADEVQGLTDGAGTVGGVVGATFPEQAQDIRRIVGPKLLFLIPGYGAQGGGADGAVAGFPETGELSGFVNSSRGITRDSWRDPKTGKPREGDPLKLVAAAIDNANAELNAALAAKLGHDPYGAADSDPALQPPCMLCGSSEHATDQCGKNWE